MNAKIYCRTCRDNRSMKVIQKGLYSCNFCGREHVETPAIYEKGKKYQGSVITALLSKS